MTTQTRMTLAEFLALPEEKPYLEFINGEVVEKPLPNIQHGKLTSHVIGRLEIYFESSDEGYVANEVRHLHESDEDQRVFLPDIHVTLWSSDPNRSEANPFRIQPDFAIEVLSPDSRPGRLAERVQFYLSSGTRLLWIVDPDREVITVYRPGEIAQEARAGDILDGLPVLRDFRFDVGRLFAVLHRPGPR